MSNIQLNRIYIREFLFLLWLRIFNLIIMHCWDLNKFPYIPVKMYYLGAELLKWLNQILLSNIFDYDVHISIDIYNLVYCVYISQFVFLCDSIISILPSFLNQLWDDSCYSIRIYSWVHIAISPSHTFCHSRFLATWQHACSMSCQWTCYPETSLYYQYSQSDLLRLSESLAHLPFLALSCSFSLYGLTMCSLTTHAIILLYNNSWSHWTLQLLLSEPMKVFFTQRNIYIICKLRNVV